MVALIIGMLICVGLALAVVALVAVPARRDGRDLLTSKGEEVVSALKDRQQSARQRLERGDREADVVGDAQPTEGDAPAPVTPAAASITPATPVDRPRA